MRRKSALAIAVLFILSLVVSANMSQEVHVYSIKAGSHTMEFIPSPELGYIVKSSENITAQQHLNQTLSNAQKTNARFVDVSGQDDMIVVLGEESPAINKNRINLFSNQSETTYVAPLFVVQGQTIAVLPEIIVRLESVENYNALNELCIQLNCKISNKLLYTEKEYCISTSAQNAEQVFNIVERLNTEDFIEWATPSIAFQPKKFSEPVNEYKGRLDPNDTHYDKQWHLDMVRAPEAWGYTTGDPNIIIAVLDDGVQIYHPDLLNNIWTNTKEIPNNGIDDDGNYRIDDIFGWNFYHNTNNVNPAVSSDAHGTACAGLIAAQGDNNLGVTGVAYNCTIMPVKISHADSFRTEQNIASAIRYGAISGADILSNSWGGILDTPVIYSAIQDVTRENGIGRDGKGCVVFFSSGNWAENTAISYPAKYQEVIAVGAIDPNYVVWDYSGKGTDLDFVTPSGDTGLTGNLWTTDLTGSSGFNNRDNAVQDYTDKMGGTSGSCPIAAGIAALILSVDPNLTCNEVKSILADSALDLGAIGWDESYGYGCLDAYEALTMVLNPRELAIYVDDNASNDPGPGNPDISDPLEDGSAGHPFDSIQEAINCSLYKDTIVVLPGTYSGQGNVNIDFLGKIITVKSQQGPESCIIDCQSQNHAFYFHSGEGKRSVLNGFTITNGSAQKGGGIYILSSGPSIINCNFSDNTATEGGGILASKGNPVISDCNFTENITENGGGGFYATKSSAVLSNCTFVKNSSGLGGAMYSAIDSNMVLNNCTFIENTVGRNGGAIYSNSSINLDNCTFTKNSADGFGGGIYGYTNSNLALDNCTFNENLAFQGGAIYGSTGIILVSNDCTFTENSAREGSGIYIYGGSPVLDNCEFTGNSSNDNGGGIYTNNSNMQITNSTFNQNTASVGGGIYFYIGETTVRNCFFKENSAKMYGGAINTTGSKLIIVNSILLENTAYSGGGIFAESNSNSVVNCTFYGNSSGIYQRTGSSFIKSTILWNNGQDLEGKIHAAGCWIQSAWTDYKSGPYTPNSEDPLFADIENEDFHLKSQAGRWDMESQSWIKDNVTSPCIDRGDTSGNPKGEIWPHGNRVNIGAYGGSAQASLSLSDVGDIRDWNYDNKNSWDDIVLFARDWNSNELPLKGDFDFNGKVDLSDLSVFHGKWSTDLENDMPEFQSVNNKTISVGQLLTFSVSALDNDGDILEYMSLGLPEKAEFTDQVFSWTPELPGTYSVTFIVSDNKSLDYITVEIIVENN